RQRKGCQRRSGRRQRPLLCQFRRDRLFLGGRTKILRIVEKGHGTGGLRARRYRRASAQQTVRGAHSLGRQPQNRRADAPARRCERPLLRVRPDLAGRDDRGRKAHAAHSRGTEPVGRRAPVYRTLSGRSGTPFERAVLSSRRGDDQDEAQGAHGRRRGTAWDDTRAVLDRPQSALRPRPPRLYWFMTEAPLWLGAIASAIAFTLLGIYVTHAPLGWPDTLAAHCFGRGI